MKKTFYSIALSAILFVTACQKEELNYLDAETGFSLGMNIVEMPPEGGPATVIWVAENPIDGENVCISEDLEWLRDFDVSEYGKIKFQVDPTDISVYSRQGSVTVSYGNEEAVFKVVQEGKEALIDLYLVRTTPTGIAVYVDPKDETMNKYVSVVEKEIWDTYSSEEDAIAADMEYFQYMADLSGITIEEVLFIQFECTWALSPYCLFQYIANSENGYRELRPDTDYAVYCYGINGEGEILTDVYHLYASTEPFDLSNPTEYDLAVDIDGLTVEMKVRPSDQAQLYNAGFYPMMNEITEEQLRMFLQRQTEGSLFMGWSNPDNSVEWEDMIQSTFYQGDETVPYEFFNGGQKVIGYAYSVDDDGNMEGPVYMKEFTIGL